MLPGRSSCRSRRPRRPSPPPHRTPAPKRHSPSRRSNTGLPGCCPDPSPRSDRLHRSQGPTAPMPRPRPRPLPVGSSRSRCRSGAQLRPSRRPSPTCDRTARRRSRHTPRTGYSDTQRNPPRPVAPAGRRRWQSGRQTHRRSHATRTRRSGRSSPLCSSRTALHPSGRRRRSRVQTRRRRSSDRT